MAKKKDLLDVSNFLIPASQLTEHEGKVIPTVLSMDIALRGGIPQGTNVLIAGKQKSGKTTFALTFAAKAQIEDPEVKVFFFDAEGRLRSDLLHCINGLDHERLFIVKSNTSKILSGEDFLNLVINTLKDNPKCICILDSIAALAPEAELTSLIGDSGRRASTPSMMYSVLRQTSQVLAVNHSTFIGLTHLIANPSGYGKTTSVVGGNAQQYQSSVWLESPYFETLTNSQQERIGQICHFNVMASALGGPGAKVSLPIVYGQGIDEIRDLITVAMEVGLIQQGGAWYTMPDTELIPSMAKEDSPKICGIDRVLEFLRSKPEIVKEMDTYLRNLLIP
jgi:recombination protein RecA